MAEETVSLNFSDNASAPAGVAAAALDRVDAALAKLEGKEVDIKTGKISEASMALGRLRDLAGRAGSAMTMALNGVNPAAAGATAAGTKLSSVFDLMRNRAKLATSELIAMEKTANKLPKSLEIQKKTQAAPPSLFGSAMGIIGKLYGQRGTDAALSGAKKLSEAWDKLGPLGPLLATGAEKAGGALLSGGKMLAIGAAGLVAAGVAIVAAAAVVAYKLLEAGLKLSIAQTSIREGFESSISKMVGGAQAAKDIFNTAIKIAVDLGLDKEAVLAKAKELVGVGFRGAEIGVILRTRADVAAGGSEEKANAFQKALEKLKSGKKFTSIDELAEAGINTNEVLKQLSTKLGISIDKVKEKLAAGKIDVQVGIQAILAAAQGQYGGAASGGANTVEAKLQGLKTFFESMFDSVDLSGIKNALDSVKKLFEGPGGEKFKAAVNTLFKSISDIFGKAFSGPEGEARLQRFLTGITKLMEGAAAIITVVGPRIIAVIDGLSKIVDRNGSTTGGSWLQSLASGMAAISAVMIGVDPSVFTAAIDNIFAVLDKAGTFAEKAFAVGSAIIQGLIRGMLAGGDPAAILVGIVGGAIAAAAGPKGADAHSPSKKTDRLGVWIGQGLGGGMARMGPFVANAGVGLAAAALGAANDNAIPAATSAGGAGGGGGVTINVNVQSAPGDTREHAQAQGDAAGEAAYSAFRRHMARFTRDGRRAA